MFGTLFLKECKAYFKSITYYVFLACIVAFYFSQMSEFQILEKPQPGQKDYSDYGKKYSEDEQVIMKKTMNFLLGEYNYNSYAAYPFGFYKNVKLNTKEQEKVKEIIMKITGYSEQELKAKAENTTAISGMAVSYDEQGNMTPIEDTAEMVTILETITYDSFVEQMQIIDDIIGGGSKYEKDAIQTNAPESLTYEEAVIKYNEFLEKDKVSNAYARLFCDYFGIMLSILPVFLAAARGIRDRKSQADQVVFVRKVNSGIIILTRYLSAVTVILIPVLIFGISKTLQALYFGNSIGVTIEYLAFLKYILGWLLPSILVSLSVGFLFTELTGSMIGILIQAVWWIVSIFLSSGPLIKAGWNLVPRFNRLGDYSSFKEILPQLIKNRIGYTIFALVLLILSILVFEAKRKGGLYYGTLFKHRKNQSEV